MKLKVNELSAIKQDGAMVAEVEARQRQNSRKALTGLAPNSIDAYFLTSSELASFLYCRKKAALPFEAWNISSTAQLCPDYSHVHVFSCHCID